jgi:hypothetical protein
MLGWILTFTLMVLGAIVSAIYSYLGPAFGLTTSAVFSFLLLISALTLVLRGRA